MDRFSEIVVDNMLTCGMSMRHTVEMLDGIKSERRKDYWKGLWAVIKGDQDPMGCEPGWEYRWLRIQTAIAMLTGQMINHYEGPGEKLPFRDPRASYHRITVAIYDEHEDGYSWEHKMVEFHRHQFAYALSNDGDSKW
jgi:hypothetical protein